MVMLQDTAELVGILQSVLLDWIAQRSLPMYLLILVAILLLLITGLIILIKQAIRAK